MRFWPARRFTWWEPRVHRRLVWRAEASSLPRLCLRAGLFLVPTFVGCGSLARTLNPNPQAPSLLVFLALAVAAGMGLPWIVYLYRWIPTQVILSRESVSRITGNTAEWLQYANCRDFGIIDQGDYSILVIGTQGGQNLAVGMPLTVDLAAVGEFLEQQGLSRLAREEARDRLPTAWLLSTNPTGFIA